MISNFFIISNIFILILLNICNFLKGTTTQIAIKEKAISKTSYIILSIISSALYILGLFLTMNSKIQKPDILAPMIATTMYVSLLATVEDCKIFITNRWRSRICYLINTILSFIYVGKIKSNMPLFSMRMFIIFFILIFLIPILWDIKIFGKSVGPQPGDSRMFMILFPISMAILQNKILWGFLVWFIIMFSYHIIYMTINKSKFNTKEEKDKVIVPLAPGILLPPYIMFILIWTGLIF